MSSDVDTAQNVMHILRTGFGIECAEALTLGNVCKTVYRAMRGTQSLVVKIGTGERPAAEVQMNREGYAALRSIGASRLIPDPVCYLEISGTPVLVMGDCGPDFLHAVKEAVDPVVLFQRLVHGMHDIYGETLSSISPRDVIVRTRDLLVHQCRTHLPTLVDSALVDRLARVELPSYRRVRSCFSTFDFTPEDVFVTDHGVKYADPLPDALGVPVIDLACFAGVARDAYALPGSEEGYRVLQTYACHVLPGLLRLSKKSARDLFSLGRALQSAFSARFRLATEPDRVPVLAAICEDNMRRFLHETL